MLRIQAFEFIDLPRTPSFVRDSIIESLGNTLRWSGIYKSVTDEFVAFCEDLPSKTLIDLGSGSGDAVVVFLDELSKQGKVLPQILISDLFPVEHEMEAAARQYPENVKIISSSVNALDVPEELTHSARTMMTTFHHFTPEMAAKIIEDCVRKGKPIFIVEPMTHEWRSCVTLGMTFVLSTLINPVISKKDRFKKALFSYLIPAIPCMGIWDSLVSMMRLYKRGDFQQFCAEYEGQFDWVFRTIPAGWGKEVSLFIGKPRKEV